MNKSQQAQAIVAAEHAEAIAGAVTGEKPFAWFAETGTAGEDDGCNKLFFNRELAVSYIQLYGGHIVTLHRHLPALFAEDRAEQFIQAAIDNAPEPLRRLGAWLANKLDDDDWRTADRLITGAAVALSRTDDASGIKAIVTAALAYEPQHEMNTAIAKQVADNIVKAAFAALAEKNHEVARSFCGVSRRHMCRIRIHRRDLEGVK